MLFYDEIFIVHQHFRTKTPLAPTANQITNTNHNLQCFDTVG